MEEEWKKSKTIGIIGLGDMGAMYAERFSSAGWNVIGSDREDKFQETLQKYRGRKFKVLPSGHFVSRSADYIIYSVEAENIRSIVKTYGPSTKVGAIVGGQTSCKNPEIEAFQTYVPEDVDIISLHSLHGPKVDSTGQPLVLINHRSKSENFEFVKCIVSCLKSKVVELSAAEHDRITADTQAVTHAAFLSMGTAWMKINQYPWETPKWIGGIENAKINIALRIFSNKWHVYAGLAITNPSAHGQILQYSRSATELFTLMIEGKKEELKTRIYKARDFVFEHNSGHESLLLNDSILEKFSLSKTPPTYEFQPNSHISLLAIVDSWHKLGIVPYEHMICSTPLFRIFLGVTEYLFRSPKLLDQCIEFAIHDTSFRHDDLEFTFAARRWAEIIARGDYRLYENSFVEAQEFFSPMIPEANAIGNEMIRTILERVRQRGEE
ncbi:Prephenate dehydrogenase [Metschnikowia bicuspidata var. bicuspidata NRRL YB-4993]|uniref:Prephenate dehydrogenase [NADP(+)] n=1 Tax=Metschnikowia bicuspidata var. bicuspidata NRRL YB-4993 TaxID=869754 RepID=A0A1A0HEC9_9ASCO|nr:Prephenate dehydrogenase [Metschnikowia bicuspidata var. bicuspidata NRRL YB-4993]OBA22257.1 Prephenate dehydrogenase [Metschnikowia bicuspidata var. bicuspidata NRRL YB-4993]